MYLSRGILREWNFLCKYDTLGAVIFSLHTLKLVFMFHCNLNECSNNTDDCDVNADCADTDGSFACTCREGYSGNGTFCASKMFMV